MKLPYTGMTRIRFEGTLSARLGTPAFTGIEPRTRRAREHEAAEHSRTRYAKPMHMRATLLVSIVLGSVTALASPPIPSDIALHLTVDSAASAPYPPGSSGEIELSVTRIAGSPPAFSISTVGTPLPLDAPVPVRFEPAADGDACGLQEVTDNPNVDGRHWLMFRYFGPDDPMTCRIAFEVLDVPSGSAVLLRFETRAYSGLSAGYIDVNPADNVANFVFGPSGSLPVPVPGPAPLAWLFAAAALLAAGLTVLMSGSAARRSRVDADRR